MCCELKFPSNFLLSNHYMVTSSVHIQITTRICRRSPRQHSTETEKGVEIPHFHPLNSETGSLMVRNSESDGETVRGGETQEDK